MTPSILKPMPAGHLLFCSQATASKLSEFSLMILPLLDGMKQMIPSTAAKSSTYAIGSLCCGVTCMLMIAVPT